MAALPTKNYFLHIKYMRRLNFFVRALPIIEA
ncbi:MAG: hypothetical protein RIS87_1551 [Pseudomonadota bacterium]